MGRGVDCFVCLCVMCQLQESKKSAAAKHPGVVGGTGSKPLSPLVPPPMNTAPTSLIPPPPDHAPPPPPDPQDIENGDLFPEFSRIRSISAAIMARVAHYLVGAGLGTAPEGLTSMEHWEGYCWGKMWGMEQAEASKL